MTIDSSFLSYFFNASLIVKAVMLLLLAASFASWVIIFKHWFFLKLFTKNLDEFENMFWSVSDLSKLYKEIDSKDCPPDGLEKIFIAGFKEFIKSQKRSNIDSTSIINSVQRAMTVAEMKIADNLEGNLSLLATIGSVSPYIGLFGTVWGIMSAFQALGHVSQASIAMVAPGISEALIATAMGLFAAIPAVIFYNRYNIVIGKLLNRSEAFKEEFSNYLCRQTQTFSDKK